MSYCQGCADLERQLAEAQGKNIGLEHAVADIKAVNERLESRLVALAEALRLIQAQCTSSLVRVPGHFLGYKNRLAISVPLDMFVAAALDHPDIAALVEQAKRREAIVEAAIQYVAAVTTRPIGGTSPDEWAALRAAIGAGQKKEQPK